MIAVVPNAWAVGGIILAINLVIMVTSLVISSGDLEEYDEYEGISLFSKRGFLFLFPPKEKWLIPGGELIFCSILSFAYGFCMARMLQVDYDDDGVGYQVVAYIVVALSSYSLFSKSCPDRSVKSAKSVRI